LNAYLNPPMLTTFTAHIILLDLTVVIIWWRVQILNFITQFSPSSCHFIPLWSKYSPRHPVLKHPQTRWYFRFSRRRV
jgi:hypothetical protein